MDKILECVPNFSEGTDGEKIKKIADCFRGAAGVRLLNYSSDKEHNRTVITAIGEPKPLCEAVIRSIGTAVGLIDLNKHTGQHPRIGAADVVPFIPIKNVTMDEAIEASKRVAAAINKKYGIPVYLYEKSAVSPERENLAAIRKGEFEGLAEKMKKPGWAPDFGAAAPHKTAGATVVGARMPLIAFNVNLNTASLETASDIAKKIRHVGGGLRFCKAMGVALSDRKQTQVSINMTDFTKTTLYSAIEMVRCEARRYGVTVVGSEIIGLVPMDALVDAAEYYLQIENFSKNQIIETAIAE
jgi:glutamate formiminotransferase